MGKNIDRTFIQSKMLNVSKGPAVHSLRAQADKADYTREMRRVLEDQEHLTIKQAEVCELMWRDQDGTKTVTGVKTFTQPRSPHDPPLPRTHPLALEYQKSCPFPNPS